MSVDQDIQPARSWRIADWAARYFPGLLVCATVAVAAQFLSDHHGAPAMLMALLLGIALQFLGEQGKCVAGIDYAAKKVLRLGVALLGVRISVDLLVGLGPRVIALLVLAMAGTMLFGLVAARLLGRGWRLAILTGGSVAICGASAAIAIAAVLPKGPHSERNLLFTVLAVTVLSTIAMIAYPVAVQILALDDRAAGIFLGGTIHDVAQVVGAGFSVSDRVGETATLVKLIRVAMLAPIVLVLSLAVSRMGGDETQAGRRPPLIPGFVLGFLVLAALNSFGLVPKPVATAAADASRWALLLGIAAVGLKSALKSILEVGRQAVILIVAETLFLAAVILIGLHVLA
ncbi:MAG: YeiH family protein [Proteobacteria bacterium]|nr:YeiH family protein [Pseudomonadota bacterium]